MSSAIRRIHIRVRGRVQGVMYRASTLKKARGLGLTGWVQNDPDGAVVLEAQGPSHLVEQLEAWCREGPPMARVTGAEVEPRPVVADEPSFTIRH